LQTAAAPPTTAAADATEIATVKICVRKVTKEKTFKDKSEQKYIKSET